MRRSEKQDERKEISQAARRESDDDCRRPLLFLTCGLDGFLLPLNPVVLARIYPLATRDHWADLKLLSTQNQEPQSPFLSTSYPKLFNRLYIRKIFPPSKSRLYRPLFRCSILRLVSVFPKCSTRRRKIYNKVLKKSEIQFHQEAE